MLFLVTLIDPKDASYLCEMTVLADDEAGAKDFVEKQNPGKKCTKVELLDSKTAG